MVHGDVINERRNIQKKSIDKIKSPDNLHEYIRVSNPSVWLLLGGVILLLVGACIWGIFGRVDSIINTDNTKASAGFISQQRL